MPKILTHPAYDAAKADRTKYRLTLNSGRDFIDEYLKTYSTRETTADFATRKEITYCPSHARTALIEIRNAIFQRMRDIQRLNGGPTYTFAVDNDINRHGKNMNHFLGASVLEELLAMGKVGIFVDAPVISSPLTLNQLRKAPYLYYYTAENILNWAHDNQDDPYEVTTLLLKDEQYERDPATGLPTGLGTSYRFLQRTENGILAEFWDVDKDGEAKVIKEQMLNIPRIPFIVLELSQSILVDVADYQIALLNLESSDISYALKSNFPFYVEQFDPRAENAFLRQTQMRDRDGEIVQEGTENDSGTKTTNTGAAKGRRYPLGTEQPAFIHPSPEPLQASMEKQESLKRDIRVLASLAVAGLSPMRASADSKEADLKGLEEGLSYIGMELEYGENQIAAFWAYYTKEQKAKVKYPRNYSLRTESERISEAEKLRTLAAVVPSAIYRREIMKRIASVLLELEVPSLDLINAQIDSNPVTIQDPEVLSMHLEKTLVSGETVSKALGYPEGETKKAEEEHAARAKRVVEAQISVKEARNDEGTGQTKDLQDDPENQNKDQKTVSQTADVSPDSKKGVRGGAKNNS